nr:mitochondrial import inner membrane translocase subunit TIM50-C-like [Onthophagus taurus]
MKYTFIFFAVSLTCGGFYLITELGSPKYDDNGELIVDQFTELPVVKQYILRTLSELDYYSQLIKEPSREKLLPDLINHPMYHPKYTLVLEFTDVIVHPDWTYKTGWRFKKRPGLDNFLESLHGTYEVVIYTAEQGITVYPIIDALDQRSLINYKLVRDATLFVDGKHVKDLDKLNRDLSKVIVVDWNGDCTKYHRDNVLKVPRWNGNDDDTDLLTLSSFLLAISHSQIDDVRDVLKVYHQFDDPLLVYKERQKRLIEQAEAEAEQERDKTSAQSPISRWRPTFFKKF